MAMFSTNGTPRRPKGVDLQLTKAWIALPLFFLLLLTATPAVDGEVPTAGDFAACNEEAPQAVKTGIASPIISDHARADRARQRHDDDRPRLHGHRVG